MSKAKFSKHLKELNIEEMRHELLQLYTALPTVRQHYAMELGSEADSQIRVLEIKDRSNDHTEALSGLVDKKQADLEPLRGFIFMQNSPSCGAYRVKAYHPNGNVQHTQGKGAFAGRLMEKMPWLPVD